MYFYVEPGDDAAISKAFKKCGQLMNSGNHSDTGLVIPQLGNLEGLISDCLGDDAVKVLLKRKSINLNPGSIRLFTKRQPPRFFKGPLLVAFTPIEQLKIIIRDNPAADIVFVPWAPSEKDFFINQHKPELI